MQPQADQVDETDLQLIHLLQLAPRIPWVEAAPILDRTPTALAARWKRLRDRGIAWITVQPRVSRIPSVTAVVEVGCRPAARIELVTQMCADPRVIGLDEPSNLQVLLLTVMVPDLGALTRFATGDLLPMAGVDAVRTYVVTEIIRDGSAWRLDALDHRQQAQAQRYLAQHAAAPGHAGPPSAPPDAWELIEALSRDGRASVAELARATGAPRATVRRHLARLFASDTVQLRCDVAPGAVGWPVTAIWFARVAPADVDRTVTVLSQLAQLRLGMLVSGDANLVFSVLSRSVAGIGAFERSLGKTLPGMELQRSELLLRSVKRMGWLVDDSGRRTGQVVVPSVSQR